MRNKRLQEKHFVMTAAAGSILITIMLIASILWASNRSVASTNDAVSEVSAFYLEAMAENNSKTITNLIDNNFDHMEKAVDLIRGEGIGSQEELRDILGKIKFLLSLSRFALVDADNIVYTQYTTYTGGSRHEFLHEDALNDRMISTVYLYGSSKQLCLAIPIRDLTLMGKPFKACFVQIDVKDIVDLLAVDDQGRTDFGLYSKNGGRLSDTKLGTFIRDRNILDAARDAVSEAEWEALRNDFALEKRGSMTFVNNGQVETLCYVPVQDTGWEMAVLIRESVIHDKINAISADNLDISRKLILLLLVTTILFAAILFLQFRRISGDRLKVEQERSKGFRSMANTDSMTGVKNKHAFSEAELALNRMLRENELDNLAIVVCDINGLKHVNDTQGHAAGDKLIVDASKMICEYFTHGAVYRTGGDEFVVLLRDRGYDTMTEVINDLNREIESNIKKDAVVISIGYSVLNEEDEQVRDVFERADKMMYERKKELKGMGAKTRE